MLVITFFVKSKSTAIHLPGDQTEKNMKLTYWLSYINLTWVDALGN